MNMQINNAPNNIRLSNKEISYKKEISAPNVNVTVGATKNVNAETLKAYTGISFGSKSYDNTNFRQDLKKRATLSETSLSVDGEQKVLELYKTKHSEYIRIPETDKIYHLRYVDDKERITQQVLASKLYNSVGIRTPEYIPFEKDGKSGYLYEVLEEKLQDPSTNKKALYKSFIADIWLANRNGLSDGNTKIDKDGNPVKLSVSGSLGYRASGKQKDQKLTQDIDEFNTMRDYSINPDAAKALASMTDEELYEAINDFTNSENYETTKKIVGNYFDKNTMIFDLSSILFGKAHKLYSFVGTDKLNKTIQKRGLDKLSEKPELANIKDFDVNNDFYRGIISKISDEDWQKLTERGLLKGRQGMKKFDLLDLTFLAKMSDEEHQKALDRKLYNELDIDKDLYKQIGGNDISTLSKLKDSQWDNVTQRDLLHAHAKYNMNEMWKAEYIEILANLSDKEWKIITDSDFLYTHDNGKNISKFLDLYKTENAEKFEPSITERTKLILHKQATEKKPDKEYNAEQVLRLISIDNKQWDRLMELTQNFTDVKMDAYSLVRTVTFEDKNWEILKKRGVLDTATDATGLYDISDLSDEEWENVQKRNLSNIEHLDNEDITYLAMLDDEKWQLVLDKHLLDARYEEQVPPEDDFFGNAYYYINKMSNGDAPQFFSGKEIFYFVNTLEAKDWENIDKRNLFTFKNTPSAFSQVVPSAWEIMSLAKMNDNDFAKYNKLTKEVIAQSQYMYSSTKYELINIPDEQFQKIFERNLLRYINKYEATDNWTEDAPIIKLLSSLPDKEYNNYLKVESRLGQKCKSVMAMYLISKAEELGLDKKQKLSQLGIQEKREYLKLLLNYQNGFFEDNFKNNFQGTDIIPKDMNECTQIMKQLVKSVGIDTRPVEESEKLKFNSAIKNLYGSNSEFKKLDLKNPNFKLNVTYPRNKFMQDVKSLINNLEPAEQMEVFDYFGFELKQNENNITTMMGYPALINNGEKFSKIESENAKKAIENIKPLVKAFTQNNKITPDGTFISQNMANTLNDILNVLPELQTIIGKEQHGTHDYTIDMHTLAVMQECINNPEFEKLNENEKQILVIASLFHDITKIEKEVDKSHPENSAYDAYYILEKLNLPKEDKIKIYRLIKNHDMLEKCNKYVYDYSTKQYRPMTEEERETVIKKYAYELRSDNMATMETILTQADLKSVKRDGYFYNKYKNLLETVEQKLKIETKNISSTKIVLPQTRIPKASELKADGKNLVETETTGSDGQPIKNKVLYMQNGLNLEQYGFDKGVTSDNFNVVIHGFDDESQQVALDVLDLADQNALLSASYVVYSKGNYHAFRQQGLIKNASADDIGAAYFRDFGSGYKKDVESLVRNYINGSCHLYRKYISDLIKKELNLDDNQYIELTKKIENKPLDVLEKENPEFANAIKKIFTEMETHQRKFKRNYNEILIEKSPNAAVYFEGTKGNGEEYKIEEVPEFLRKYAQDNNLPIIYFGK